MMYSDLFPKSKVLYLSVTFTFFFLFLNYILQKQFCPFIFLSLYAFAIQSLHFPFRKHNKHSTMVTISNQISLADTNTNKKLAFSYVSEKDSGSVCAGLFIVSSAWDSVHVEFDVFFSRVAVVVMSINIYLRRCKKNKKRKKKE